MKHKDNHYGRCLIPLKLQMFAEGPGAEEGSGGGQEKDGQTSFDDFLKGEGNQAEFDRRVQAAVKTAVEDAQKTWKLQTDDKLSEAEKLAKMTKEEKAQYLQQKKEKELTDREAAITRKELMAEAKNTLAEKKLPVVLADLLDYTDAEACSKSILTMEKAFQKAVEDAVEERLKGKEPPRRASASGAPLTLEEQIRNAVRGN